MESESFTNQGPQTLGDIGQSIDSTATTYTALIGENLGHPTLKFSLPIAQFINISGVGNRKNINDIEAYKDEFHAQRNLIREHALGLARYTLMGLVRSQIKEMRQNGQGISTEIENIREALGDPAYASLQPIVTNIRQCEPGGGNIPVSDIGDAFNHKTGVYNVTLSQKHTLWVVDGQHRREGFDLVLDFLRKIKNTYKYPKRGIFEPLANSEEIISETIHDFWMSIFEMALSRATVAIECHLGLNEREEQQLFLRPKFQGA